MSVRAARHCILMLGVAAMTTVAGAVELRIEGTQFTLDGQPTFLLGISYYGALGAPMEFVRQDFDDFKARGINWVRVWATWGYGGNVVSAVTGSGRPREPFMDNLVRLVREADERGIVVDVTISRGNGAVSPDDSVQGLDAHLRAVKTLAIALKPFRNVYFDLGNERNIRDPRYVPMDDLKVLRAAVAEIDPKRLATASHAGDISDEELRDYLDVAGVDFIAPHRPRNANSPGQTEAMTRRYLKATARLGRAVPVHYQEPFRRDFSPWQPVAQDFLTDLRAAVRGGAAGWCLHNGGPRRDYKGPDRSFDMRRRRLMDQLDAEETAALEGMARVVAQAK